MSIFVSHSRENSSAAFRLCEELAKRNIQTWLDIRSLEPGAEWDQAVKAAIENAIGFVFVIGPSDATDRYQAFEWQHVVDGEYYLDASKPLIPVLIGTTNLPGFLKARQSIVLHDSGVSFEQAADEIAKLVTDPSASVDPSKLELGRKIRSQALESLREYSEAIGAEDLKRAGTRVGF